MTESKTFEKIIYKDTVYYITYSEYFHNVWITETDSIKDYSYHKFRPATRKEIEQCINDRDTSDIKRDLLTESLKCEEW